MSQTDPTVIAVIAVIDIACDNLILLSEAGSRLLGLETENSDHDRMGIFIEPWEHIIGLTVPLDSVVRRSQPAGQRSGPQDIDNTYYSLRKYLRLATAGNPSVLVLLFAPESALIVTSDLGDELLAMRDAFLSKNAVKRFLGYMHSQRERMLSGSNKLPNRPELVKAHGYDTKYAAQAVRLAYQGMELAGNGTITIPSPEYLKIRIRDIRNGEILQKDVIKEIEEIERWIRNALETGLCTLPERANLERISSWSIRAHQSYWNNKAKTTEREELP